MDVNTTLRENLLYEPFVMENRFEVLHHLFIVNGNGYEWKGGEIVEVGGGECPELKVEDAVKEIVSRTLGDVDLFFASAMLKNGYDPKKSARFAAGNIEKRINGLVSMVYRLEERMEDMDVPTYDKYPYAFMAIYDTMQYYFYPISEYSKICNIPDDVKDDWLSAAKELCGFIADNPQYMRKDDREKFDKWLPIVSDRTAEIEGKREKI